MGEIRKLPGQDTRAFEVNYEEWVQLVDELGEMAKTYETRNENARRYGNDVDPVEVEKALQYRRMRESLMRPVFHAK